MKGYAIYLVMGIMAIVGIPLMIIRTRVRNKSQTDKETLVVIAFVVFLVLGITFAVLGFMGKLDF